MTPSLEARLVRAAALLATWRDVLEERGADDEAPGWAVRRGWDGFLRALPDGDLAGCEVGGAAAVAALAGAPEDLVALAREVAAAVVAVREAPLSPRRAGRFRQARRGPQADFQERLTRNGWLCPCRGALRVLDSGIWNAWHRRLFDLRIW